MRRSVFPASNTTWRLDTSLSPVQGDVVPDTGLRGEISCCTIQGFEN